ncbi:MAG: enoyl-CoA hydratase/isomerase family protein [Acidimicrobiales bacterium]
MGATPGDLLRPRVAVTSGPGEVTVDVGDDHVATVEIHRPPANFFDIVLVRRLADTFDQLDADARVRAAVLCSEGRHFCAGADFHARSAANPIGVDDTALLYREAVRLFSARTPFVAAVQGAAVGGGLGLACAADFRVATPGSRFAANFARLGIHQGFGLSITLPAIVGRQRATELLYTGRRLGGDEAHVIGLADRLVADGHEREAARTLAREIAASAPLAVASIRETMRGHLAAEVARATEREHAEQVRLRSTADFAEGLAAGAERREPRFTGR